MKTEFAEILTVGGKSNTLGRAEEIIQTVLADKTRLHELYTCLFEEDAWVRMRAVDSLEKVCRVHPDWLKPYVDRLLHEVAEIDQPSIQWHLAQMFSKLVLSPAQYEQALVILKRNLADTTVDWIVAANSMSTLMQFVKEGRLPVSELLPLLKIQQTHHSKSVVKRATKLLDEIEAS